MNNLMLTKTEMTRYSASMRLILIVILAIIAVLSMLGFIAILIFAPAPASAEESALPPPTVSEPASSSAGNSVDAGESAPNLHEALKSPKADSNVDVRSYQRKDGARVTEYSLHGQIYEIKVQPAGGMPAYYLYRNKAGHMERRRPGGQPFVTPPSWILQKF